jgi:hypothetical protein
VGDRLAAADVPAGVVLIGDRGFLSMKELVHMARI